MARSRPTAGSDGSCVADKPKVKLLHSMSSMVTVIVGPSEQVFCIYESLLRSHSAFFEAALSGDWREGKDKVVRLNDVHRYFFGCFLEWLCNGCLVLSSEIDDEADEFFQDALNAVAQRYPEPDLSSPNGGIWDLHQDDSGWLDLIECYVFADRIQCDYFMNAIIDDILGYHYDARFDLLKPQALRYAFERTPKTSRLRKLLLHIAYYEGTSEFLQANFCASQHPDVIIDLGKLLAKHGGVMKPDGTRDFEKVSWPYDCEEPSVCKCYHVHRKPLVQREKKAASAADVLGGNRSAV